MQEVAMSDYKTSVGPWGGSEDEVGDEWSFNVPNGRITKIMLLYDKGICAIRFCSVDDMGDEIWSEGYGDFASSGRNATINLGYPEEKLTFISGTYGSLKKGGPFLIRSIAFITNLRGCGPFGRCGGISFNHPLNGTVTGFFGRADDYLYSIGVNMNDVEEIKYQPVKQIGVSSTFDLRSGRKRMRTWDIDESSDETSTKLDVLVQNLIQEFKGKTRLTPKQKRAKYTSQFYKPYGLASSIWQRFKATFDENFGGLSSIKVTTLQDVYRVLEKHKSLSVSDSLVLRKVKTAIKMMEEVEKLGDPEKVLEVQLADYKQECEGAHQYFSYLKKSINQIAGEHLKSTETTLANPLEVCNWSLSALVKHEEKGERIKNLAKQVEEWKAKKRLAVYLLESN